MVKTHGLNATPARKRVRFNQTARNVSCARSSASVALRTIRPMNDFSGSSQRSIKVANAALSPSETRLISPASLPLDAVPMRSDMINGGVLPVDPLLPDDRSPLFSEAPKRGNGGPAPVTFGPRLRGHAWRSRFRR